MKITAENVVQQIKLKNEEALTFLISSYGGLLKAIVRKYLHGNQQDIEECLSDVIVSIWYHIESYDASKNEFKQWIAAIAKYRALDYVRKGERSMKYRSNVEFNEMVYRQPSEEQIQYDISHLLNELSETSEQFLRNIM
ncbi:sigma-70 family RNA polymerase sigma factor [Sutcliffiella sp. NC1]|nr:MULTISPECIES: sigma-70 family RNA polymerase sigma factor [Sutcliffiella]WBL15471.1 sigma-70 family RNA polymerase sigma factor [Sutcliffiella sp. NC1]